ncbi:hypothetical protein GBA65_14090 [Rubrobacter marinus]|uniref:Helix-turn-helix domain-containing protein n=1 Tax=Rubrobacter marinus TaxID=2653852 RepID=A0A6G8PZ28_9ACTN|nr:hypothetical protein [Rubrobacter marinus]QIN79456.1 hypothetical protein GBA65_14090 [Rubrobacter marinus]
MAKMFYEVAEAAALLGVANGELEEMFSLGELSQVAVGTSRRLVRVRDVEAVLARVHSGGRLRTRREFRATSVPGAVEKAAAALGIAPERVSYQVLERGNPWSPGTMAKEARIAVDLPGDAPEDGPAPAAQKAAPGDAPSAAGDDREDRARYYYAPEQAARLLGISAHEANLLIYRKKLPTVNINDYRWVTKEALAGLLEELSPPELESPPSPFAILTAPEDEAPGLGTQEIRDRGPELLERRVEELEEEIEALKRDLELERGRRAAGVDLDDRFRLPSTRGPASEPSGSGTDGTHSLAP